MSNPKIIYLEPLCQDEDCEYFKMDDRNWSENDAWKGDCCHGCSQELPEATTYLLSKESDK